MKWRIYLGIGLSVWETAWKIWKWLRSVGNGSNMWEMKQLFGQSGLSVWETAKICGKWLDLWEMSQICGQMT